MARSENQPLPGTLAEEHRLRRDLAGDLAAPAETDPNRDLVDKARSGDVDAFKSLLENNQQRVFGFVRRMLRCDRDAAADLVQEVFLRIWKGLPAFDYRARFTTWLYKICLNLCISEQRRRRTMKRGKWTYSLDEPIAGTDGLLHDPQAKVQDPGDAADQRAFTAAVREAVAELPKDFREAVVLRDLEGLDYEQIAEVLDIPPGTVRSRIHRGRLLLQELLKGFRP